MDKGRETGQVPAADATDNPATEQARMILRSHRLRCTAPRLAVMSVLGAERPVGHLSVAEIHQRVRDGGPGVDVATVYRTVTTLVDLGVLHALAIDGGVATYGLAESPHHHAVCTQCSAIIEVPADRLTSALEHAIEGSSFTLSERAGLTLHGLCPDCQAAQTG